MTVVAKKVRGAFATRYLNLDPPIGLRG